MTRDIIESELNHPANESLKGMGVHFVLPRQTDLIFIKKDLAPSLHSVNVPLEELNAASFYCTDVRVMIGIWLFLQK